MTRPPFLGNVQEGTRETCRISSTREPLGEVLNLTAAAGLRQLVVYHERLPPGRRASSSHAHSHKEELVYVLSGTPHVWIDGKAHPLGPGDYVALAAATGIMHHLVNDGVDTAEYLVVASIRGEDVVAYPKPPSGSMADGNDPLQEEGTNQ